jgi:lysozyme family protein
MPKTDVYMITDAEVAEIYEQKFWNVVQCNKLPAGLDLCVFDASVNSGPGQAGKWLQRALGDKFTAAQDGIIGSKTLQAVEDYGDNEALINAYCSRRLATLHTLKTWSRYGKGWSARIANVMKTANAWSANEPADYPVDVSADGGHKKAPISDQKVSKISQATAHVTTAATSAGAAASQVTDSITPVQTAFPDIKWIGYILGGLAVVSAITGLIVKVITDARTAAAAGTTTVAVNLDADAGHPQVPVNDANPPPVAKAG